MSNKGYAGSPMSIERLAPKSRFCLQSLMVSSVYDTVRYRPLFTSFGAGRDKGGYYHQLFLRSKLFLSYRMLRIKLKGKGVRKAGSPETEPDFYSMSSLPMDEKPNSSPKPPQVERRALSNRLRLELLNDLDLRAHATIARPQVSSLSLLPRVGLPRPPIPSALLQQQAIHSTLRTTSVPSDTLSLLACTLASQRSELLLGPPFVSAPRPSPPDVLLTEACRSAFLAAGFLPSGLGHRLPNPAYPRLSFAQELIGLGQYQNEVFNRQHF
jgi:hypothetical protein